MSETVDVRLLHDQRVPMRDGVTLSADVYLPLSGGARPALIQWTPYESTRERFIARCVWYAQHGYAAIIVDVRGRYESGGQFYPWVTDGIDAHDTLTWAAAQPWCNGRIGTWGRSYGGLVQWQLAHLGHPNLVCVAPQVIHDDYFWDGYFTGGAFQLALTLGAGALWSSALALITGPSAADIVLNERIFRHLPLIDLDEVIIGRKVDYWRDWWDHQTNDEWWQQFHHRPEKLDVPIFQQGGWFDPYSGSHLRKFAAIGDRVPSRVMMGPWSHEEEVETLQGRRRPRAGVGDEDRRPRDRVLRPLPQGGRQRLGRAAAARAVRSGRERVARRAASGRSRGRSSRGGTSGAGGARTRSPATARSGPASPGRASRPTATPTTRRIPFPRSAASTPC